VARSWNDRASGDSLRVSPPIPDNSRPLLSENEIDKQFDDGASLLGSAPGQDNDGILSITFARICILSTDMSDAKLEESANSPFIRHTHDSLAR
jgi:hypothetical protein